MYQFCVNSLPFSFYNHLLCNFNLYVNHLQTMIGLRQTRRMIICRKWRRLRRTWRYRDCREAPRGCPVKRTGEFHRAATEIEERRNSDNDRRVLNTNPGSIPARWPVLERGSTMPRKCLGLWRGRRSPDLFSPGRETSSIIPFTGAFLVADFICDRR